MLEVRKTSLVAVLALALLAPAAAPAQVGSPAQASLDDTNSDARSGVAQAVEDEAGKRGLVADSAGAVFATRDDVYVVNSILEDAKGLTRSDLARGADVGLVYLDLPAGSDVPSGWYTVRVTVDEDSSQGTAELIDANGAVAGTFAAEVGSQTALLAGRPTLEVGWIYVCVDYHWGFIYVKLCIGIKIF